jgi:hypothetical protein
MTSSDLTSLRIRPEEQTYEPHPDYSEPEIIAYDFGYKESQVGNAFWTEDSADRLFNLVRLFLLKAEQVTKISDAYSLGFHHGSRVDVVTTCIGSANPEEMNEYPD